MPCAGNNTKYPIKDKIGEHKANAMTAGTLYVSHAVCRLSSQAVDAMYGNTKSRKYHPKAAIAIKAWMSSLNDIRGLDPDVTNASLLRLVCTSATPGWTECVSKGIWPSRSSFNWKEISKLDSFLIGYYKLQCLFGEAQVTRSHQMVHGSTASLIASAIWT